ncbi:MAG: UPF0149 family protein [Thermodesulfobacteriota bacterium]
MSFESDMKTVEELLAMGHIHGCDPFTPVELLGFFFGLAITPADIGTGEWLEVAFARGLPDFESKAQEKTLMEALFRVLDDFFDAWDSGELAFPYDMEDPEGWSFDELDEWAYGLYNALLLRPGCWDKGEGGDELTPEERELFDSLAVVTAVADQDAAPDYFEVPEDEKALDDFWLDIFHSLPAAVDTLIAHARTLEERRQRVPREEERQVARVGRNDPCPCGSGRKHKNCCLRGSKIVPLH